MSSADDRLDRMERNLDKIADTLQQLATVMLRLEQQEEKSTAIISFQEDLNKRTYTLEKTVEVMQERDKNIIQSNAELRDSVSKAGWWIIGLFGSLLLSLIGGITMFLIKG